MLREIVPTAPLFLAATVVAAGNGEGAAGVEAVPLATPIGKEGGLTDAFDAMACFDEGDGTYAYARSSA